jgi:Mg2+ and Co2+ transporter CorA
LTITACLIDKNAVRQSDFSNSIAIKKEMVHNPEESLWVHGDEPEDIFQLQGIFGLHPLSVEAVTHQNQPSKIVYDEYLFTIVDGVRYDDEIDVEEKQKSHKNENDDKYNLNIIEDDEFLARGNDFTVGDALNIFLPNRQKVIVNVDDGRIRITYFDDTMKSTSEEFHLSRMKEV